jgi:hypothetical protein
MERDVIVSENSDENWKNDAIQFPRLIAEIEAAGGLGGEVLDDVAESMGLTTEQVMEVVDRAQKTWDALKNQPPTTPYLGGAPVYLGADLYVQDEETVTRIYVNEHGRRAPMIELSNEEAQVLFNELAKRRKVT